MADPLSASASIITIIGTGFAIAKGLDQLADGIGTAGQEVRIYADEIDAFSRLLDVIRELLQRRLKQSWSRAENLLEDILHVCQRVLVPMEIVQATLTPLLSRFRSSPGKFRQFSLRVQWIFSTKEKLLFYRAALKGQHRLLDTTLIAMHLTAEGQNSRIANNQRLSIQNCMAGIRRTLHDSKHMHVGASQSATQLLTPFSGNASTLEVLSPESAVVPNGRNTPQEIAYAADLSQQTQSFSTDQEPKRETPKTTLISGLKATNSSQALALSPLRQKYSSENLEDHNTDQIDEVEHNINEVLDVQFKNSGQEVWEDMRTVSRKVLQYATDILSTDPTPNGNSDDPSQASSLLPKLKPDTQSGIPIENPKSSAEPLVLDTKHGKIVTPPSQVKNMDLSLNEDGVHVSQHDNDRQRSPVAPPVSDRVTIKNIDGKSYQVPYASVREWEDMKSFLMSLRYPRLFNKYGNIIGIHNIFDKEEFEMVDPEGNCILPQFWTQYLQPGWTIEQRFIDNDIFWEGKNPPEQPPYLDLLPAQPTERSVKSSEGKLRNFGKVFKRKY